MGHAPPEWACPLCTGLLVREQTAYLCPACKRQWPIYGGIPDFTGRSQSSRYTMAGQSTELNQVARADGWRSAARIAADRTGDPAYQFEYITSEARADFRFLMPVGPEDMVLDLGSGWGNMSIAFARACRHVIALDTSRDNLEFVQIRAMQEGLANVSVVQADAVRLPLPPASCDAALMVGVLEWVAFENLQGRPQEIQRQVLSRVWDTLAPGGCLYLAIENRFAFKYFLGGKEPHTGLRFVTLMPMPLGRLYSRLVRHRDYREITYSLRGLDRLLRQAGFGPIRVYFPLPGYQSFRYLTDYKTGNIARFVLAQLRAHPRYTRYHYLAARIALSLGLLRWTAPCFGVLAYKGKREA